MGPSEGLSEWLTFWGGRGQKVGSQKLCNSQKQQSLGARYAAWSPLVSKPWAFMAVKQGWKQR